MKKILFTLGLISTFIFSSCSEDFLDVESETQIAEDNFWQNEQDAFLALNGVYASLQPTSLYGGMLNAWIGFPSFDCFGDNSFNQFKWEGAGTFMEGTATPADGPIRNIWQDLYRGIARANIVIQNVQEIPDEFIEEESRQSILGQALFLRSLMYFNLAVYYEDVPLILEFQDLEDAYVPKNQQDEIMEQIIDDLIIARDLVPMSSNSNGVSDDFGYATRGSVLGLLARVQLYNHNYAGPFGVIDVTEELLGMGYSLHPNYGELFTLEGQFSNEVVFSVRFLRDPNTGNGETLSATFANTPKIDERPMPNLVNDYYCTDGLPITESPLYDPNNPGENRDPRANASIYFPGDLFLIAPDEEVFTGNSPTGFGKRKYIRRQTIDDASIGGPGSQDFYVIRYADVLLMRAEALAETGDLGGAAELINQVRARVGMPSVEDVEGAVGQQEMIDIVRHERRVELALEGLRFMDLKRWGEMQQAVERAAADPVPPYNPIYNGLRTEVFYIPQNDLDVNPNLEQHPAW